MKKLLIIAGVVLILIGGLIGIITLISNALKPGAVAPVPVGPAIATADFSDGSRLEVMRHAEGSITVSSPTPPAKGGIMPYSTGTKSYGGSALSIGVSTTNEIPTSITYRSQGEGDLILEMRTLDPSGKPISGKRQVSRRQVHSNDDFSDRSPLKDDFVDAITDPAADPADWPVCIVQLSDGAGGWITGNGPIHVQDDPEHRGALVFRGWPQTTNPLVFRALRPGCAPVEFDLHRPSPAPAPPSWTAAPLPQIHKDPDFTVSLQKLREVRIPNVGHYLELSHEFSTRFAENNWEQGRGAKMSCNLVALEGALGSRGTEEWISHGDIRQAVPVPPDETLFRAHYRITRERGFPQPQSRAMMIAEAEVDATGTVINVTSRTSSYSITKVEIDNLHTKGSHQAFDIKVQGEWKNAAGRAKAAPLLGTRSDLFPVVFIDGGTESTGDGQFQRSGEHSNMSSGSFDFEGDWIGPLKPGQKLKLGLASQLPQTDVFFTFDRSAITE